MQHNDQSQAESEGLITAIRQQAEERIAGIRTQAELEIKGLETEHAAAVARLTRELEEAAELKIKQERSRISAMTGIELKKQQLIMLEDFIAAMIERALTGLVTDCRQEYRLFLSRSAGAALAQIARGCAMVHLSPEDFAAEAESLRQALGSSVVALKFVPDRAVGRGGCMVEDTAGRIRYIATLEKAVSCTNRRIRCEALELIKQHGHAGMLRPSEKRKS
jgi:vacuolar-type H+-ATPase subunit E/Vma4